MKTNYPLSQNTYTKNEINALKKVILSGNFTMGENCQKFESQFSKFFKSKNSIFVNSGSSANLLAISALSEFSKIEQKNKKKITKNSEIIVSKLTWPTTVWPIIQNNFKPIFVDCNLNDLQMSIQETISKINNNTFAIFVTHVMGGSVDMQPLLKIAKKLGIWIIEDTCESMGAKYRNKFCGTIGDIGTFSTFFSHHISTVEGGVITTQNDKLANLIRSMRAHGWVRDRKDKQKLIKKYKNIDSKFLFTNPGFNLRPTEFNGVLGIEQLKKLNFFITKRKTIYKEFKKIFNDYDKFISYTLAFNQFVNPSPFCFTIIFKRKSYLERFEKYLKLNKIEYRPIIGGNLLKHPAFSNYINQNKKNANANKVMELGIYVGINPLIPLKQLKVFSKVLAKSFI